MDKQPRKKVDKSGPEIPREHILKYPNRRLYCRIEARYITLEDVKNRLEANRRVTVTDKKTGKDLTRHTFIDLLKRLDDIGEGRIDETELRSILGRKPLATEPVRSAA